jgi:hypothetical protein
MKLGGVVLTVMLWLAGIVFAPPVLAGDLNPPGPPAPTMQSLNQVPPFWEKKLRADDGPLVNGVPDPCNSSRFKCVLDDQAVLDRETGLVWERNPDSSNFNVNSLTNAKDRCVRLILITAWRGGWRLPAIQELVSLVDYTVQPSPSQNTPRLSHGHPFTIQATDWYWSATDWNGLPGSMYGVQFGTGNFIWLLQSDGHRTWCVRGAGG